MYVYTYVHSCMFASIYLFCMLVCPFECMFVYACDRVCVCDFSDATSVKS